jgi:hypothetical protein
MNSLVIKNTEVHGVDRAINAVKRSYDPSFFDTQGDPIYKTWAVAKKLGQDATGHQSHDHFLSGIRVWWDMQAPNYFLDEFKRYKFVNIIMSSSTQHSIEKMLKDDDFSFFTCDVDCTTRDFTRKLYNDYEKDKSFENWMRLRANLPSCLRLCLTCDTSYLELKTMVIQRTGHRLKEWTDVFIPWVYSLPHFMELTGLGA